MGYDFCMKNNNRRVILNRFFEELEDETFKEYIIINPKNNQNSIEFTQVFL